MYEANFTTTLALQMVALGNVKWLELIRDGDGDPDGSLSAARDKHPKGLRLTPLPFKSERCVTFSIDA